MDFYQSISAYYDRIFPTDPNTLSFLDSRARPGSRILDIACGTGGYSIGLAERGHRVTGIDLNRAMIRRARSKTRALDGAPDFRVMDMLSMTAALEFLRDYELDPDGGTVNFRTELRVGGDEDQRVIRNQIPLRIVTREQLTRLVRAAGFNSIGLFGGFDGRPLSPQSLPLILSARRG